MRPRDLDARIDKLYQLPLDQFTAARNLLAREVGSDGGDIRQLQKPPLAAWAVNQLYWNNRGVYDELVDASTALRAAHKAVLGGRRSDLRAASKVHDEALERALKATLDLLAVAGHNASDATRQAVLNTLRALPAADPPGRLARTLQPGGFEMLAGFDIAAPKPAPAQQRQGPEPRKRPGREATAPHREDRSAALKRRDTAREAVTDAAREAREAETELRRHEFAAARAAKEAEKAASRLEQAREALAAAEREVEEAQRTAATAGKVRARADRDAADAHAALEAARRRLERAEQALADVEDA